MFEVSTWRKMFRKIIILTIHYCRNGGALASEKAKKERFIPWNGGRLGEKRVESNAERKETSSLSEKNQGVNCVGQLESEIKRAELSRESSQRRNNNLLSSRWRFFLVLCSASIYSIDLGLHGAREWSKIITFFFGMCKSRRRSDWARNVICWLFSFVKKAMKQLARELKKCDASDQSERKATKNPSWRAFDRHYYL